MDDRTRARAAFARRDWDEAHEAFLSCGELEADDLDALAESAQWLGRPDDAITWYRESFARHQDAGDARRAALAAFHLGVFLRLRGEPVHADAWQARALRLLADEEDESAEQGYPLYLETARLMGVDLDEALASAHRMQDLGTRFADATLVALGVFFEGRALIKQAHVPEGLARLDEAMLAVLSDTLKPFWTGAIYCGLLDACHELTDVRRAQEWTDATQRWCSPLPGASLYPGICRVHWATVLRSRGSWEQAEAEAAAAGVDLTGIDVFAVADSHYELGMVRLLRGDLPGAEAAFLDASELGRDPQPGLALLRLAQGRTQAALSSITAALAGFGGSRLERSPLVAAHVRIALAAGDVEGARAAAAELDEIATAFDTPALRALAAECDGAIALVDRQAVAALATLRRAFIVWQELDVPYEAARTRVLLADAYDALGDADAAGRERASARACFERLGAAGDLAALDAVDGATPAAAGGLTAREVEVLGLVAGGMSNRAIAGELHLSEKTVARHVSNIFTKLGVTSRTAAAAHAFATGLIQPAG